MTDKSIWTDTQVGPASYSDGGIVVTTSLVSVEVCSVAIAIPGANLGQVEFDIALNAPSAGDITVKVMRKVYRVLTSMGNLIVIPSNITPRTTSGGAYLSISHNHSLAHDHATATSSTPIAAGGGAVVAVGGINLTTHTHAFNAPNLTGNTGSEATHNHTFNFIYEHQHVVVNTARDVNVAELAAATDLSGTTLNLLAVGTV